MPGSWQVTTIGGKKADVFHPSGNGKPRFAILFLHPLGLETLVGNSTYSALLEGHNLACICPHGQQCWWTDRICPDFDQEKSAESYLIQEVLPHFHREWNIAPRAVGLLGISMGGQGALRLAFKHPRIFPVVAGISSAIEYHELYGQGTSLDEMYDSKEQCRQDTAIMHVPPYQPPPHVYFCIDPLDRQWFRGNDRLHEKLNALGVEHLCDLNTSAGGHGWEYFNRMAEPAFRFILSGLESESRRLL